MLNCKRIVIEKLRRTRVKEKGSGSIQESGVAGVAQIISSLVNLSLTSTRHGVKRPQDVYRFHHVTLNDRASTEINTTRCPKANAWRRGCCAR